MSDVSKHYRRGYKRVLKEAGLKKEGIFETARHGFKALKGALKGGTDLNAPSGVFEEARQKAVDVGEDLIGTLDETGIGVHRARVKSPESIEAKDLNEVPDDLLGMQTYGKSPEDVKNVVRTLKDQGVEGIEAKPVTKPGYHGVNIKGQYEDVPVEMQISPSRTSNAGQILEHSLGYKQQTEAPYATAIDKWVGEKVAPKLVNWDALGPMDPSWINEYEDTLQQIG